ncbi:peptidylprolyl isomerase [Malassezia yamatoensis]|uniref:Peptidylprolyl isomerase n=1 Tax=Malassezia yamatoensis TaxID=253288 RepID=A0AAJ6CJ16_9BASI|nr:peptidylprolyl isomerase [Malassezia yamatoensis]
MGHGTNDKLFVTPSEHSGVYGQHGASTGARKKGLSVIVPFTMCSLTYEAWSVPACLKAEGNVYERANLEQFLRQYGVSPATGQPVNPEDMLDLHFSRNDRGNFFDPVSCKEMTDHSHLVAIGPTGHVFLHDTVQQLNIKSKFMRDLVDDTPFQKSDILILQDPHDPERRKMSSMYHVRENLNLARKAKGDEVHMSSKSTQTLLSEVRRRSAPEDSQSTSTAQSSNVTGDTSASSTSASQSTRLSNISTGRTAASFTSSSLTPRTKTERISVDEEAIMFESVLSTSKNARALVKVQTNLGTMILELHVSKAPRTCYNFLMLSRTGAYNDTLFHRNIAGFMIQGGDPTGTGRGGQSIWVKPFEDELCNPGSFRHTGRGVLSMANRGPNTNGSQFFITYRATPQLDTKHTVFGRLIGVEKDPSSMRTLDAMENVPSDDKTDRPLRPIIIEEVKIVEDPFEDFKQQRDAKYKRENMDETQRAERDAKRRKRQEDRTTWLGTRLANDDLDSKPRPFSMAISDDPHGLAKLQKPRGTPQQKSTTKVRSLGDFSGW